MKFNEAFEKSQREAEAPAKRRAKRLMEKYPLARLYYEVGRGENQSGQLSPQKSKSKKGR